MRKLRKILLSTIFALTVSTTFFANTAGTQTVHELISDGAEVLRSMQKEEA